MPSLEIMLWIEFQSCVFHTFSEMSLGKCLRVWPWTWTSGRKGLLKPRRDVFMITPKPPENAVLVRYLSPSPGYAMQSEWHDIKALPHQDWKAYNLFFCLQAVNYLTSTHNEQCKTSQNLIKRQRQGLSADGKWLTQLIKHPSIRLNMASLSQNLKKGWESLHFLLPDEHLSHVLCWPLFILSLSWRYLC